MNLTDFPLGPFVFSTGGVIFLLGGVLATWILTRTVHEKGLSLTLLNQHLPALILITFAVGRIANIWQFWIYFESEITDPSLLDKIWLFIGKFVFFWHGGIDVFWSAIGFLATLIFLIFKKRENIWKWLDVFVLPTLVLITSWSLGAFFSAWNYGRPVTDSFPFGVTYDVQEVRYSLPLHPVQIYAFFYFAAIFALGWRWWSRRFFVKDGTFFGVMSLCVFLGNGLLEFFRGDPTIMMEFGSFELRVSQLVSFILAVLATFFLLLHTHPEILRSERKSS